MKKYVLELKNMKYVLLASIAGNFAKNLKNRLIENKLPTEALFLTTAANPYDDKSWMEKDIKLIEDQGIKIKRIDFAHLEKEKISELLNKTNTLIVGGGNPIYLLEVLIEKEVLSIISNRVKNGMIYVGSSAGSILATKNLEYETLFEDRKDVKNLSSYQGLNFFEFNLMPHWGYKKFKNDYIKLVEKAYNNEDVAIPLTDKQAIEIIDDCYKIISI